MSEQQLESLRAFAARERGHLLEHCPPENHEERWRAVWECLGWNPDTARERYLERRAGK